MKFTAASIMSILGLVLMVMLALWVFRMVKKEIPV